VIGATSSTQGGERLLSSQEKRMMRTVQAQIPIKFLDCPPYQELRRTLPDQLRAALAYQDWLRCRESLQQILEHAGGSQLRDLKKISPWLRAYRWCYTAGVALAIVLLAVGAKERNRPCIAFGVMCAMAGAWGTFGIVRTFERRRSLLEHIAKEGRAALSAAAGTLSNQYHGLSFMVGDVRWTWVIQGHHPVLPLAIYGSALGGGRVGREEGGFQQLVTTGPPPVALREPEPAA
jgi:hypothetical protein